MGKYIRKAKTTSEVAVMDLSFGVRTRAKTLALQRQRQRQRQRQPPPPPPPHPPSPPSSAGGYLQLRSRRLVKKPPILVHVSKRQKDGHSSNSNKVGLNPNNSNNNNSNSISSSKSGSRVRVSPGSGPKEEFAGSGNREEEIVEKNKSCADDNNNNNESKDLGVEEASFGENVLDIEGRESTRESTPCSLIRDPESIRTPGSTTRPSSTEPNRTSMRRHIPTAHEMDEFFTGAEEEQQKRFIEKYNFDPVNDKPLAGRYEWAKLDP
ncbi:cyclin-dependent kinase inhibitor 4 isoform X4 [Ricinus communis]|uniref:cyclin-dependent kinase inhibitor 4 isoform X4 n=1 Tax=Ricinus communis TaxID=3988 RepID=UPI000772A39F|nr:cyclin-dependent kinase inhibitor 4 isoform X4 [Ricinus communis]|eukprot:XP_015574099.1 cyclin-dependent kinase inhibitor 4 isoform X2 [Ricinus communis]